MYLNTGNVLKKLSGVGFKDKYMGFMATQVGASPRVFSLKDSTSDGSVWGHSPSSITFPVPQTVLAIVPISQLYGNEMN